MSRILTVTTNALIGLVSFAILIWQSFFLALGLRYSFSS
jgi:hypothetical protein